MTNFSRNNSGHRKRVWYSDVLFQTRPIWFGCALRVIVFPFPPEPPDYGLVVVARIVFAVVAVCTFGYVAYDVSKKRPPDVGETLMWFVYLVIGAIVGGFFSSTAQTSYDDNEWVLPITALFACGPIVAITFILTRLYSQSKKEDFYFGAFMCSLPILICVASFGLSMADVGTPRHFARKHQCRSNVKYLLLAMHNFEFQTGRFPPAVTGNVTVSWRVRLLPLLGENWQFKCYDQSKAWDATANRPVGQTLITSMICPANYYPQDDNQRWFTAYSMPSSPRSIGESAEGISLKEISDGSSNTVLLVEACGAQIVWTEPREVDVASGFDFGINSNGARPRTSGSLMSSYHRGGAFVGMADGSAKFMSQETDLSVVKAMLTIDGKEDLALPD